MARAAVVSLEALRARIQEMEGTRVRTRREPTGIAAFDALVGGLPRPGFVELHGPPGSGRTALALALASGAASRELVAWVDLAHTLYPPAAADHGVDLRSLLVVRPPSDRSLWAVEQLLRSGCFPLVVVSGIARLGRTAQGWAHAAEAGHATGLVVSEQPFRELPAVVRIAVGGGEAVVVRDREGRPGRSGPLPSWPTAADPWG